MQRVFIKDVQGANGKPFKKKGDVADYPRETWEGIVRSVLPKAKDWRDALDSITQPVSQLAGALK